MGGWDEWADEGMGLGLKGTIPPPHFTLGRLVRLPRQSMSVQGAWEYSGVQEDS